jgi:hypothetical protein
MTKRINVPKTSSFDFSDLPNYANTYSGMINLKKVIMPIFKSCPRHPWGKK